MKVAKPYISVNKVRSLTAAALFDSLDAAIYIVNCKSPFNKSNVNNSFSDGQKGTFNILLSKSLMNYGRNSKEDAQNSTDFRSGTIKASSQLILDSKVIATIAGDALDSSLQDSNNKTITITGKRTL